MARPAPAKFACLVCRKELKNGEKVVRVEIVQFTADGYPGTRQELGGEYVHLDHIERAAIVTGGRRAGH
jgi:hypothetical protein